MNVSVKQIRQSSNKMSRRNLPPLIGKLLNKEEKMHTDEKNVM